MNQINDFYIQQVIDEFKKARNMPQNASTAQVLALMTLEGFDLAERLQRKINLYWEKRIVD